MQYTRVGLEGEIINVLLNNARKNGRYAYMTGPNIGREVDTYRKDYQSRASDPDSRKHYDILKKLRKEGVVDHVERIGWRLRFTDAEWEKMK